MSRGKNKRQAVPAPTRRERRAGIQRDVRGRVHLELHRDARGDHAHVSLVKPVFSEPWQNEVAAAVANTAYAVLAGAPSLERAVELGRNAMVATSRLAEGFLAHAPPGAVACRAGCEHCCYQMVGVTAPEVLAIVDHLAKTRSPEALERTRRHVAERYEATRQLSPAERFSASEPCAFLEAGRCSIYEVRPLSCRGMNSLDAEDCARRLREPEARAAFLERGGGRSFMEPIRAFHAVSAGLQLSLAELYRLDMRPLDLIAAVNLLLNGKAPTSAEWLAGQDAFASARGREHTNDAAMQRLSGALPSF